MVLAVIVGIGSTFFSQYVGALQGHQPSLSDAMSLMLASLSLFGLGIFGPGIATGLVSGAPQLGAGAALGTAGALVGATALGGAAAVGGARLAGAAGMGAIRAGTALGAGASTAYQLAQATSGSTGAALALVWRAWRVLALARLQTQQGVPARGSPPAWAKVPRRDGTQRFARPVEQERQDPQTKTHLHRSAAAEPRHGLVGSAANSACARTRTPPRKPSRTATAPAPPPLQTSISGRAKWRSDARFKDTV
jgi:hypothetical protein